LYGVQTLPGSSRPAGPGSIPAGDWHAEYQDFLVSTQVNPTSSSDGGWNFAYGWSYPGAGGDFGAGLVGYTAVAELILSPVALVLPANLTLAPLTATNPVGTTHTVTATATSVSGSPVAGATVTFTVISGPNMGTTGTDVTDASGVATFTYTDSGGAGTDTIQANIGQIQSNTVEKIWQAAAAPGRMTGGGSVFTAAGQRVTHGFELHCDAGTLPNNLQVNWGRGNRFHLGALTSAACSDNPAITPNPPAAGFDTFAGTGTGSYNGVPGATITFTFTDAGEPGKNDYATMVIKDAGGNTVLTVSGNLNSGNQQAHKD
jgi:hypothetical protein